MDVTSVLAAFGLSGAAGLNAWLPLFAGAVLERVDAVDLAETDIPTLVAAVAGGTIPEAVHAGRAAVRPRFRCSRSCCSLASSPRSSFSGGVLAQRAPSDRVAAMQIEADRWIQIA